MITQYYKQLGIPSDIDIPTSSMVVHKLDERVLLIGFVSMSFGTSIDIVLWKPTKISSTNAISIYDSISDLVISNLVVEAILYNPQYAPEWNSIAASVMDNGGMGGQIICGPKLNLETAYSLGDSMYITL